MHAICEAQAGRLRAREEEEGRGALDQPIAYLPGKVFSLITWVVFFFFFFTYFFFGAILNFNTKYNLYTVNASAGSVVVASIGNTRNFHTALFIMCYTLPTLYILHIGRNATKKMLHVCRFTLLYSIHLYMWQQTASHWSTYWTCSPTVCPHLSHHLFRSRRHLATLSPTDQESLFT